MTFILSFCPLKFPQPFHLWTPYDTQKVKCLLWPLIPWNLTLAPQPEDSGAQEEDTQEYYDPEATATNAWGDDGSQPVRYDPIAAATEGWGDDGTQPVRYNPVAVAHEGGGDDESQQVHYDPVAEAQEGQSDDESQPVTEVSATEDETPAAEAPAEAAEEETTQGGAALDNEEGQVTKERKMERCIWIKMVDALIFEEVWAWCSRHMHCEWKVERRRILEMEIFRMHLDQQRGCINCDTEVKVGNYCWGKRKWKSSTLMATVHL